jgi:hypothetical protein
MSKKRPELSTSEWSLQKPLHVESSDVGYDHHVKQLRQRGFSDSETWSLDVVISKFILPRLKRFKEVNNGYPGHLTPEGWNEIIDKMIFAFEFNITMDEWSSNKEGFDAEVAKYEEGMQLFAKYFRDLWW